MKGDKMTPYIENLTNSIIGKHRFDELFRRRIGETSFVESVSSTLEVDDVQQMKPETLGRVLCSLEVGDVILSKKELLGGLHFSGDPGDTLREMVAVCLAKVIHDRLDPRMTEAHIPRYKSSRPSKRTALVSTIGERHHSEIAQERDRFWCSGCNGDSRTCNCE
jgi:hypothetical protein